MRTKKVMAMLLTAAMLMTSSSFASIVSAAEMPGNALEAVEEDTQVSDEQLVETDSVDTVNDKAKEKEDSSVISDAKDSADNQEADVEVSDSTDESKKESIEESDRESEAEAEDAKADKTDLDAETVSEDDLETDDEGIASAEDYFYVNPDDCNKKDGKVLLTKLPNITLSGVVTIPECVEVIPASSELFKSNTSVTGVVFEDGSKLTEIEVGAFSGSGIETVDNLPAGITEIKDDTFKNSSLKTITYKKESNITKIGNYAFAGTDIGTISFSNVKTVGEDAFSKCINLSKVTLSKVETIGASAFEDCEKLSNGMNFPATLANIGNYAFKNCGFTSIDLSKFKALKCTEDTLAANTDVSPCGLGIGVFSYCKELKSITISDVSSDRIKVIPNGSFSHCPILAEIGFNRFVETIKGSAFEECPSLREVDLSYVRVINSKAFDGCSGITTIKLSYYDEDNILHMVIDSDAFPLKEDYKVTIKGFDEKVEEYAGIRRYKFESLFEPKTITVEKPLGINVAISPVKEQIHANTKVTVTVTTANTTLADLYYTYTAGPNIHPTFVKLDGSKTIFEFIMPDKNITLKVFGDENATLKKAPMSYDFEEESGQSELRPAPTDSVNRLRWESRGYYAKLKVFYDNKAYGNWAFLFSSANPNCVAISDDGVITGLKSGSSLITITSKIDKNKKLQFTVEVDEDDNGIVIAKMNCGDDELAKATSLIDAGSKGIVSIDPITKYPVVTVMDSAVANGPLDIKIGVEAYKWNDPETHSEGYDSNTSYAVLSTWASTDRTIASIAKPTSITNQNIVTINKGVYGETQISISTLNTNEKVPNEYNTRKGNEDLPENEKEHNIAHVIIRVVDPTPRLTSSNYLEMNCQLKTGLGLSIVPVYGYEISDDDPLKVCTKELSDGTLDYVESLYFERVKYNAADNLWYLKTTDALDSTIKKNQKKTFKNMFWLWGKFKMQAGNGSTVKKDFYIPIDQLVVMNNELSPRITQVGKINVFYNHTASEADQGSIVLTQSEIEHDVERYEFVSTVNGNAGAEHILTDTEDKYIGYAEVREGEGFKNPEKMVKNGRTIPFDSLSYNFDIEFKPDTVDYVNRKHYQAVVTRSQWFTDYATYLKRPVVSGYLYIYYTEYKHPVKVPITLSTMNTPPVYMLSKTSVVAHSEEKGQEYDLYLYPYGKANKFENAIDLSKTHEQLYSATKGEYTKYYIEFDENKNTSNFKLVTDKNDPADVKALQSTYMLDDEENLDGDITTKHGKICLKVKDGSYIEPGQAVINMHMTSWSDPEKKLSYTFKVTVTDKLTAKLSTTTQTLNRAFVGGTDQQEIVAYASVDDAGITDLTNLSYRATANNADSYQALANMLSFETGVAGKDAYEGKIVSKIILRQPATRNEADEIKNGRYAFTIQPTATINNTGKVIGEDDGLKPVTFAISVTNANPRITIGGQFALSANPKVTSEVVTASCKITGLLPGTTQIGNDKADPVIAPYTILYGDAKYTKAKTVFTNEEFKEKVANIDYDAATVKATATKEVTATNFKNLVGTYTVSGVKVKSPGGSVADAGTFNVMVKAITLAPAVQLRAVGKINMIVPASYVEYTTTLKNVSGTITGAVAKVTSAGSPAIQPDSFAIRQVGNRLLVTVRYEVDDDGNVIFDGYENMKPNSQYKIRIYYGISSMGAKTSDEIKEGLDNNEDVWDLRSDALTITPVQVFPTVTTTLNRKIAFAGQDRETGIWDMILNIQVAKEYRAYTDDEGTKPVISIDSIEWAPGVADRVKDEFRLLNEALTYEPRTGIISIPIRLRNASEQLQDRAYELPFTIKYQHQAKNTTSPKFSILVKVNK